jgi:hypothetical protein
MSDYGPFCSNVMKCGRFLHIMRFLHFENNENLVEGTTPDCNRLWKIGKVFSHLTNVYSSIVSPYRRFGS